MRDEDLLKKIQEGNADAAAALVETHWERIFRYLYRLCGSLHDAEDLAQQTFLRLFERPERYIPTPGGAFQAWLYRVATNLFLDRQRRSKREGEVLDAVAQSAPPSERPDDATQKNELAEALERAVLRLPEDQRIVLTLRVNEEMAHGEIARIVGVEVGTVRWRLHEARRQLARLLEAYL